MKERGILFSAPMVRALLAGTKTQTRRIVKGVPDGVVEVVPSLLVNRGDLFDFRRPLHNPIALRCPYGTVGDRLWVREAFRSWTENHCEQHESIGIYECDAHCSQTYVAYRATPRVGFRPVPDRAHITYLAESSPIEGDRRVNGPWKSSLFLPHEWSRLTLEITEVRVQRLQEISEEDAKAEGARRFDDIPLGKPAAHEAPRWSMFEPESTDDCLGTARFAFGNAWNRINGDRAPWSSNPWVWAISFKRVEQS